MLLGSFRDLMFLLNFLKKSKKSKTIPIVIIKKCLLKISLFFLIFKTFKKLKESFPYLDRYQRGLIGHRGEIYRFSLSDYRINVLFLYKKRYFLSNVTYETKRFTVKLIYSRTCFGGLFINMDGNFNE